VLPRWTTLDAVYSRTSPASVRPRTEPRRSTSATRANARPEERNARKIAELLRVPESTVQDWARRGVIPSGKIGRRRLYLRPKIEALLLTDDAAK